jgi:hypothetical protein
MNTVVYEWLREDGSPYYVGIGNPKRPYTGKRSCGYPPPKDRIVILYEGLDWQTACEIEKDLIAFYGRKDLGTGILRNLTDGGDGIKGLVITELHRNRISRSKKGRKLTKEQREFLSESRKGKNNPMHGKIHPSRGSRHPKYKARHWFHPICGEILNKSASELVEMFPEQELKDTSLCSLSRGDCFNVKGWRTLSCPVDKNLSIKKLNGKRSNPKRFNWFHPDVGEIYNKSCSELCELFPEYNLDISGLSLVPRGLRGKHKGWGPICCPIKP